MNRPEQTGKERAMNSSLLRRIVRLMREMNYASHRMVELQAPWIS
jgi:hypothetical protein